MKLIAIAAMDNKRGIAKGGAMPWHIKADLKRFRALTMGCPILMGRRTFDSLGKPLLGRLNIVLTRSSTYLAPWPVRTTRQPWLTLTALALHHEEAFIIGGAEIYRQFLNHVHEVMTTEIKADYGCDTFFPSYEEVMYRVKEVSRTSHFEGDIEFDYVTYEKLPVPYPE